MGDQKALRQGEHLNTKFMKIKDHLNMQQASKMRFELLIFQFSKYVS